MAQEGFGRMVVIGGERDGGAIDEGSSVLVKLRYEAQNSTTTRREESGEDSRAQRGVTWSWE
jgi:hypothetical protein